MLGLVAAEIEPTPDFGSSASTGSIPAIAKVKGRLRTLLDIDCVLSADATRTIAHATV